MKKKKIIFFLTCIFLLIIFIIANIETTRSIVINQKVTVYNISLYVKILDFYDRHYNYKYLVKMPMDSVSKENSDKLLNERTTKEKEVEILKATSIYDIWWNEI